MNLANQPARTVAKPSYKRSAPTRANQGKFSTKTIKSIIERDNGRCVRCGSYYIEYVPHHIIFRSALGKGTVDNGCCVCSECHRLAHSKREVRKWFEEYREKYLLSS